MKNKINKKQFFVAFCPPAHIEAMLYKLLAQYETRKFSGEISRGVLEAEWKIKTTKKKDLKNRKHLISCLVPCWPRLHTSCLIPQLLGPTLHYCLHVLVICLYAGWSIHQTHISPIWRQGYCIKHFLFKNKIDQTLR